MIEIKVNGLAELKRSLERLPQQVQTKIMRGATSTAAAVFRVEAEALAPMYTGDVQQGHPPPGTLKKAIYQVRITEESVGTREAWRVSVHRGQKRGKGDKGGSLDEAYYASWVEYGTVKMSPKPFMRPAFETKKTEAINEMAEYIRQRLPVAVEGSK